MKLTKTKKELIAKLEDKDSVLTYPDILKIKNHIAGAHGAWQRKDELNEYQVKLEDLINNNSEYGYKITDEQTQKGLLWLKQTRLLKRMTERQKAILNGFQEFRFMYFIDRGNSYVRSYMPVYRVIASNNDYFDYYAKQIGSASEIEEV